MNALLEFQDFVHRNSKNVSDIRAVSIYHDSSGTEWDVSEFTVNLPEGFTMDQYAEFTQALNFEYNDGYGGQELFGTIWFNDGTWATRGEYDGHEWWEYHCYPPIHMTEIRTQQYLQQMLDNPEDYGLI